ncbi:MAG TPA: hypothetical protein VN578_01125 [Candidatus Binatia bacterium]|nr:hypothetical protein [Candidatus Binatia bacterium]
MGGHYGTIHVRTQDREPVRAAVETLAAGGKRRFLIAPPLDGWVTVFPDKNGQDSKVSKKLAKALPDKTLIHCLVHDDDIFAYWLYEAGDLVDAYDSCPGYFSGKKTPASGGNVEALRHLLPDAGKIEELKKLLKAERLTFEVERQDQFAAFLGLPHTDRAYEYLMDGETDGVRQWKQFLHVPDLTSEKAAAKAAAAQERAEYKQLQEDGLLLVSEVGKKSSNKHFFKAPFWTVNPSRAEVFLTWPDHTFGGSGELEWLRFGPPDWRGEKAALPPIGLTDRLCFSPTGAWQLTSAPGSSRIDLWDRGQVTIQKQFKGNVAGTAFSADEQWLFVVVHHYPPKTEIHRLALRPESKDAVLENEQLHFAALVPHPGGQLLAAVDNFGVLVVIDVEQMRIVQERGSRSTVPCSRRRCGTRWSARPWRSSARFLSGTSRNRSRLPTKGNRRGTSCPKRRYGCASSARTVSCSSAGRPAERACSSGKRCSGAVACSRRRSKFQPRPRRP